MVLKLAFVGCGKIARVHLKALKSLKDQPAVITTLVDVNVKAAIEFNTLLETHCEIFQTLQEANQHGDFDAALLMVPHNLHLQFATECLKAGKHVLVEKPVTTNIPDCMKLMEHASSTDKVIFVAENAVFWPEVVRATELIKEGVIGDLYYIHANYFEEVGKVDFSGDDNMYIPEWYLDVNQSGGGAVIEGGIHWIRALRILFGEIRKVIGIKSYPWKASQGESLAHALLQFENDKFGVFHCHVNDIPMEEIPFFQIFGTKGEITIHGKFEGGITIRTKDSCTATREYPGGYIGGFGPQLSYFISMIGRGKKISPEDTNSVWEGSKDVAVARAIYKSIKTQSWESTDFDNLLAV